MGETPDHRQGITGSDKARRRLRTSDMRPLEPIIGSRSARVRPHCSIMSSMAALGPECGIG